MGHGGVCFRIPGTDTAAQAELVVSELDAYHGEMRWYILVQMTKKWKPQHNDDVQVSKYAWHTGTVLHVVHNFANVFQQYHMLFNNGNKWKTKVVTYMRNNGPPKNLTGPNCLRPNPTVHVRNKECLLRYLFRILMLKQPNSHYTT